MQLTESVRLTGANTGDELAKSSILSFSSEVPVPFITFLNWKCFRLQRFLHMPMDKFSTSEFSAFCCFGVAIKGMITCSEYPKLVLSTDKIFCGFGHSNSIEAKFADCDQSNCGIITI